jgi:DNA-binding response OmpR family regulator
MRNELARQGYEVEMTESMPRALELLQQGEYDIMIAEPNLYQGWRFGTNEYQEVREKTAGRNIHTRVIVLSSMSEDDLAELYSLKEGVNYHAYLRKPTSVSNLISVIEKESKITAESRTQH